MHLVYVLKTISHQLEREREKNLYIERKKINIFEQLILSEYIIEVL